MTAEWKTFDTAPKDFSQFIVMAVDEEGENHFSFCIYDYCGWWFDSAEVLLGHRAGTMKVTHWITPPQAAP